MLIYIDGHKETKAKLDGHAYKRVIWIACFVAMCVLQKCVYLTKVVFPTNCVFVESVLFIRFRLANMLCGEKRVW